MRNVPVADSTQSTPEWSAAAAAAQQLQDSLVRLRLDREATVDAAQAELSTGSRQTALTILRVLGVEFTEQLIAPLLDVALTERHTHIVRELLGRLPYVRAEQLVPPAVWRVLDAEDDGDAYRRMAELLAHLGLDDALRELCQRAYDHDDPDVREIASDFAVG